MRTTALFFILLFLLSCLGQVISDVYLPALPVIEHAFNTRVHVLQLSIALYFYGYAASHLVYGPVSDSVGRRKPLLIGIVIAIIGTLICQFSHNIEFFNFGRLLQGLGAGSSAALFRSILRDAYSGNQLAKVSSYLGIGRIFFLASSPLIGSYLLRYFGWRSCFTFLIIYSAICLVGCSFFLKETNDYQHLHKLEFSHMSKNAWVVLKSPIFLGYTICIMLAFGGILAWLTTLPILLQERIGLSPVEFGWVAALSGLFFAVGGFINAMLVNRMGLNLMLKIGSAIMLLGGVLMLVLGLLGYLNTIVIMVPVITFIIGTSLIFPNAYAGAFHPFPKIAGTAGAIFGFLQMLGGALSSMAISYASTDTQVPLAIALIAISILSYLAVLLAAHGSAGEKIEASVSGGL